MMTTTPPPTTTTKKKEKKKSSRKEKKRRKSKERHDSFSKRSRRERSDSVHVEESNDVVLEDIEMTQCKEENDRAVIMNMMTQREVEEDMEDEEDVKVAGHEKGKEEEEEELFEDEVNVKIKVSKSDPAKDPLVISFPNGLPRSLRHRSNKNPTTTTKNNHDDEDAASFSSDDSVAGNSRLAAAPRFEWDKEIRKNKKRVTGRDDKCSYSGTLDRPNLCKVYVAVYDKQTKTLVAHRSAEKGSVAAVYQRVNNYNEKLGRVVDEDAEDVSALVDAANKKKDEMQGLSYGEKKNVLFQAFGSSKKKKMLNSLSANKVQIDSVVGAGVAMLTAVTTQTDMSETNKTAMEQIARTAVAGTATNDGESAAVRNALTEARRNFLPPFDHTTTKPHEIYDMSLIAGRAGWDQINRTIDACVLTSAGPRKRGEWIDKLTSRGHWNEEVIMLLNANAADPTVRGNKTRVKTIVLLRHVLAIHALCKGLLVKWTAERLSRAACAPVEVTARFLELFTVPDPKGRKGSYLVNKHLKDKRNVYILVMYLAAHGMEMKVGSINNFVRSCLLMEVKDAMRLYREAGCTCQKDAQGNVSVVLNAPLTFPSLTKRKR